MVFLSGRYAAFLHILGEETLAGILHGIRSRKKDRVRKERERTVHGQVLNYFLETYVAGSEVAENDAGITKYKQPQIDVRLTLLDKALQRKANILMSLR